MKEWFESWYFKALITLNVGGSKGNNLCTFLLENVFFDLLFVGPEYDRILFLK